MFTLKVKQSFYFETLTGFLFVWLLIDMLRDWKEKSCIKLAFLWDGCQTQT